MPNNQNQLREAIAILQSLLQQESASPSNFPIWKTVTTGSYSVQDYFAAIEKKGMTVSQWAKELCEKTTAAKRTEDVDLVRVKVGDMGIDAEYPTTQQIYDWAEKNGLELCPAEVGLALRLEYENQPTGEWLVVGMKPIADQDGYPDVFRVGRSPGGLWLHTRHAYPVDEWDAGNYFLFRLRK